MGYPKVLITGSKGHVGRALTETLSAVTEVYGLDIVEAGDGDRYFQADIADFAALYAAFKQIGPVGCVVHLAANPRVDASWQEILDSNIIGTRNVYECARLHGIKRVIFASSIHAVGATLEFSTLRPTKSTPPKMVTTHDPVQPYSDYGVSKVFGEAIARKTYERYGVESICLRFGAVRSRAELQDDDRIKRVWLSLRDMAQLVKKSIVADTPFGIYFAVSDNRGRYIDIANAMEDLGYRPEDDAFRIG